MWEWKKSTDIINWETDIKAQERPPLPNIYDAAYLKDIP